MALLNPGVQVTVSDESIYLPSTASTVPLFFIATKYGKLLPNTNSVAYGTIEAGVPRLITSLRESIEAYGFPVFKRDVYDQPLHGDCRNEYGLFALNQFLKLGNRAYVIRADIDLDDDTETASTIWESKTTPNVVSNAKLAATVYLNAIQNYRTSNKNTQLLGGSIQIPVELLDDSGNVLPIPNNASPALIDKYNAYYKELNELQAENAQLEKIIHDAMAELAKTTSTFADKYRDSAFLRFNISNILSGNFYNVENATLDTNGHLQYDYSQYLPVATNKNTNGLILSTNQYTESTKESNLLSASARLIYATPYDPITSQPPVSSTYFTGIIGRLRESIRPTDIGAMKNSFTDGSAFIPAVAPNPTATPPIAGSAQQTFFTDGAGSVIKGKLRLHGATISGTINKRTGACNLIASYGSYALNISNSTIPTLTQTEINAINASAANDAANLLDLDTITVTGKIPVNTDIALYVDTVGRLTGSIPQFIVANYPNNHTATEIPSTSSSTSKSITIPPVTINGLVDIDFRPSISILAADDFTIDAGGSLVDGIYTGTASNVGRNTIVTISSKASSGTVALLTGAAFTGSVNFVLNNRKVNGITIEQFGNIIKTVCLQYERTQSWYYSKELSAHNGSDNLVGSDDASRRLAVVNKLVQVIRDNSSVNMEVEPLMGSDITSEGYEFNLVLCPGFPEVADEMLSLVEQVKYEALVLADTPMNMTPRDVISWGQSIDQSTIISLSNNIRADNRGLIAYYYPHGYASNLDGYDVMCAASGIALAALTNSDNTSYVWMAPAGPNRGLVSGTIGVNAVGYVEGRIGTPDALFKRVRLNEGLRDSLYSLCNINPIHDSIQHGVMVWGQKTRVTLGFNSALDRINVTRLVMYIRRGIRKALYRFLMEPNDDMTRKNVTSLVNSYLHDIKIKRGLYDFAVLCDTSNNTADTIDRNELYVHIALKPTKAIEFIYVPITLVKTGDSVTL